MVIIQRPCRPPSYRRLYCMLLYIASVQPKPHQHGGALRILFRGHAASSLMISMDIDLLRPPNLMLVLAQLVTLQWHTGRELGEFCSLVRVRRQKDHSPMLTNGDFSIFGFDFLCINVPQSRKFLLLHEDRKLLYMTEVFFSRKTIISCAYDRIKM